MKDIDSINIDELKKIIYSSNTKTDILKYFGINKLNNIGYKLLKKIENITSINIDELYKTRKYNNISEYYKNPKICKYCGSIIKYDNRKQDFCNKKCSILYLNNKKKKHKQCKLCGKELVNTSNTFCNKECYNKYLQNVKNDKITKWLNGELEVKNSIVKWSVNGDIIAIGGENRKDFSNTMKPSYCLYFIDTFSFNVGILLIGRSSQ